MGAHHAVAPHGNCAHGKMTWISWRSSTCHPAGAFVPPTRTGSKHIHRPIWSPRPHAGSKPVPGAGGVVGPVDVLGSGDVGCGDVGSVVVGGLTMLVVGDVGSGLVAGGDVGSAVVGGTTMLVVGDVGSGLVGCGVVASGEVGSGLVGCGVVVSGEVGSVVVGGLMMLVVGDVGSELVGCGDVGSAVVGGTTMLVVGAVGRDEVGWTGDVGVTGGTVLVVGAAVDDAVGTSLVVDDVVEWLVAGGSATTVPGPVGIDGALVGCTVGTASALGAAATERAGTGGSDVAPLARERLAPASLAAS